MIGAASVGASAVETLAFATTKGGTMSSRTYRRFCRSRSSLRLLARCIAVCALALACGFASGVPCAHAADATAVSADRDTVVRGLEAQYAALMIRERKLADDRETRLLSAAEARLKSARAELSALKRESAAELTAARADYAKLAVGIVQRDAAAQAEIEAYRPEAKQRVAQATPEELTALQQFADGDRVVAESVLMSIRDARKRATLKAAAMRIAQDERATADEHDVMREHGEATVLEVLKLYETAAEDDPDDWKTNWEIGEMSRLQYSYDHAAAAYARAAAVARTDRGREAANRLLGVTQIEQAKFSDAEQSLRIALDLSIELAAAEKKSVAAINDLTLCYLDLGRVRRAQGDVKGAMASYQSALHTASQADASSTEILFLLANVNGHIGDLQYAAGDAKAALPSHQAELGFGRRAAAIDPKSALARYYQGRALDRIGRDYLALGDKAAQLASYEASIRIFGELAAEDPTSTSSQENLATGFESIGIARAENHDLAGARESFQKALDIHKKQAAQHPDSPELQIAVGIGYVNVGQAEFEQGDKAAALADSRTALDIGRRFVGKDPSAIDAQSLVAASLDNLAQIPGSGVSWAEVVAQFQGMKDRGQLQASLQADFDEAKRHAAEQAKAKEGGAK
jgi:tetratricopeptide (TPR) repeat protein